MAPDPFRNRLSRRQLLVGGATAVAAAGLVACGGDDDDDDDATAPTRLADTTPSTPATPSTAGTQPATTAAPAPASTAAAPGTSPADGPVTFTDDRGETITFERPPRRVVAWQAIVPALVELGIEPVGVLAFNDLETNPAFIEAGVNLSTLTPVSTSYGEVDIEALALLEPDAIITYTFGGEFLQGFADAATERLAGEIAPFVVFDGRASVMSGIERTEELAALLGADLMSDANRAAAADFEAAVDELSELIAGKPGLTAAFGGPSPSGLFVAPVDDYPELIFYRELGMDIFSGPQDSVFSWELVESINADVFLIDDRTTAADLADAAEIATWSATPAVAAGQFSPTWRFLLSYSRADYARTIRRMLPTLQAADPTVA